MPGGYGQGQVGDENYLATQDTKGATTEREANMESGKWPAAQPHPQQDRPTSKSSGDESERQQVSTYRTSAGANGARPKRIAIYKYSTLASKELSRDTATMGPLKIGEEPEETATIDTMDMETV